MRATKLAVPGAVTGGALVIILGLAAARTEGVLGGAGRGAATQDMAPASASLLRRVAAAADGYRTGEPVWVVVSRVEPHAVAGVFPSRAEAERVARERESRVFGPYVSPRDWGRMMIFAPRPHWKPTIYGEEYPRWRLPESPWLADDVDSVIITAYHKSGATWRGVSRGVEVDAVFFTLAAHDKFVYPYYAALSGPDVATRMRESLGAYIRRAPERP